MAPGACWCFFNNMLYGFSQIDAGLLSSNVVLSRFFLLSVYELTSGESRESVIYLLCKGRFELVWLSFAWGIRCLAGPVVASIISTQVISSSSSSCTSVTVSGGSWWSLSSWWSGRRCRRACWWRARPSAASSWSAQTRGQIRRWSRSNLREASGIPRSPRPEQEYL